MSDASEQPDPDPLLKAVGDRIRRMRVDAGMQQRDFADAAGMTAQHANRVELGHQNVSLRTLARVAQALGTTMAEILSDAPAETVAPVRRGWRKRIEKTTPDGSERVKRPPGRPRKVQE